MKKIILGIFLLWLLDGAFARADDAMATFKGYAQINRVLKERVTGFRGFQLGQYVGEPLAEAGFDGLVPLLGSYRISHDLDAGFENGHPNSLTVVIWSALLSGFADDIGSLCTSSRTGESTRIPITDDFKKVLEPLCQWPAAAATSPLTLRPYWQQLLQFDAPDSEYQSWSVFAEQEARAHRPATLAVSRLTLAALFNPYFLLRN